MDEIWKNKISDFGGVLLAEPLTYFQSICLNQSNLKPNLKIISIFKEVVLYIVLDAYSIFFMFMTL